MSNITETKDKWGGGGGVWGGRFSFPCALDHSFVLTMAHWKWFNNNNKKK